MENESAKEWRMREAVASNVYVKSLPDRTRLGRGLDMTRSGRLRLWDAAASLREALDSVREWTRAGGGMQDAVGEALRQRIQEGIEASPRHLPANALESPVLLVIDIFDDPEEAALARKELERDAPGILGLEGGHG